MNVTGDIRPILIPLEEAEISSKFKPPGFPTPFCNITYKGAKYKKHFLNDSQYLKFKQDAEEKNEIEAFEISVFDGEGNYQNTELFFSKEDAEDFISTNKKKESAKLNENEHKMIEQLSSALDEETYIIKKDKPNTETTFIQQNIVINKGDDDDDNGDLPVQQFDVEEFVDTRTKEIEIKAKDLLISAAKFYLKRDLIDESEFIAQKLKMEQSSLVDILIQVEISKRAILKVANSVINGVPNAKLMEALTSAQNFVFSVNKFQLDYLSGLQKSLKEYRLDEDSESYGFLQSSAQEVKDAQKSLPGGNFEDGYQTNDRIQLIKELNKFLEDSKKIKTPSSPNKKLNDPNDTELGEQLNVKGTDDISEGDFTTGSGIEGY